MKLRTAYVCLSGRHYVNNGLSIANVQDKSAVVLELTRAIKSSQALDLMVVLVLFLANYHFNIPLVYLHALVSLNESLRMTRVGENRRTILHVDYLRNLNSF